MKMKILFGVLVVCLLASMVSGLEVSYDWPYGTGKMQSGTGLIIDDGDTLEMDFKIYDSFSPSANSLHFTIIASDGTADIDTTLNIACNNQNGTGGAIYEWFTGNDDTNITLDLGLSDTWTDDNYVVMSLTFFPLEGAELYKTETEVGNISYSLSCNFTADGEELYLNFLSSVEGFSFNLGESGYDPYTTPNDALSNIVTKIDEFIGIVFDIAEMIAILISIFIVIVAIIIPYKLFIYVTRKD